MGIHVYMDNGTQADRIIKRFGNARKLAAAIVAATGKRCDPSRVYKWRLPRAKGGTDGIIPSSAVQDVRVAARYMGILLRESDWSPEVRLENRDIGGQR